MHPVVFNKFDEILRANSVEGRVLEIGAIPCADSLLCMEALSDATEKIGLNIDGPHRFADFEIMQGNANRMAQFEDESFDVVLCNAMLEHDPNFWLSIAEIKRVTKPGGLVVIGTPGYTRYRAEKIKSVLHRIPLLNWLEKLGWLNFVFTGTPTLHVHNAPGDYYRFSPQAFREVFFAGLTDVEISSVMIPPRIIGHGRKTTAACR